MHVERGLIRLNGGIDSRGSPRSSAHWRNQLLFIISGKRYITTFKKLPIIKPIIVASVIKTKEESCKIDMICMIKVIFNKCS